ncbi:MAG: hypothetical protein PHE21_03020 [Candidatus Dojkabacteria bacterium]|nr:hypothetical protein [Candidatus Dojkabacteria bacterium]
MNKKVAIIIMAVLFIGTAIFTFTVFFPTLFDSLYVNTQDITVVETNTESIQSSNLGELLQLENGKTSTLSFELSNRYLPEKWEGKTIYLKYTYLGEFSSTVYSRFNQLLKTDYSWRKQLDKDNNIVLGGPMFLKDGVYQLHVHNGLSLAKRYYLFGELLDYLNNKNILLGTVIKVGDVRLECTVVQEMEVEKANNISGAMNLLISTCLERNGDLRLVSGWKIITE